MCGIAGILYFGQTDDKHPVGQSLLTMSECLQHRGADSAGLAVFTSPRPKKSLQVVMPATAKLPEPQLIEAIYPGVLTGLRTTADGFAADLSSDLTGDFERAKVVQALEEGLPGSVVTSLGNYLSVHKTVGQVKSLTSAAELLYGSHGIAHLRLATESKIDPAHAQPFWGRPFADIAVTHNGHITNYYKLRQKLEARNFSFASMNDSEIIGILIGEKLSEGFSLNKALSTVIPELDGSYSFIVATSSGIGVARDPFATKPLLFVQTDDLLAIASEQQALHRLLGEHIKIQEIQPKEYRTWEKA